MSTKKKNKAGKDYSKKQKCDSCDKEYTGASYLSDIGWICEKCFDIEIIETE